MALPHIGLSSLSDKAIASTWGYDLLVHEQIHCVSEKRLYPIHDQSDITSEKSGLFVDSLAEPKPVEPEPAVTTFEHEFWIEHAKARKVCVAGDFNRWTPALSLTRAEGKTWRAKATLPLAGNRAGFAYKFVVDDTEWVLNPSLP